ncbi:MAG: S8 family serine peptidase [Pseudomonadota bacterium]
MCISPRVLKKQLLKIVTVVLLLMGAGQAQGAFGDNPSDYSGVKFVKGELVVWCKDLDARNDSIHGDVLRGGFNVRLKTRLMRWTEAGGWTNTIDRVSVSPKTGQTTDGAMYGAMVKYNGLADGRRMVGACPNIYADMSFLPSDPTFAYPAAINPLDQNTWYNPYVLNPVVWGLQWNLHNNASKPISLVPLAIKELYRPNLAALLANNNTSPILGAAWDPNLTWAYPMLLPAVDGSGSSVANADIDAPQAWETWLQRFPSWIAHPLTVPASRVSVAVIDSGVYTLHEDLAANVTPGYDFVTSRPINSENPGIDLTGHGTAISGIIAAQTNNGIGMAGIGLGGVAVMPLRVSGALSDIISSFDYAIARHARVINCSWSYPVPAPALQAAIENAGLNDILVVAAAGNGGADLIGDNLDYNPIYPAAFAEDNIIAVASTDNLDNLSPFSNYGAYSVHLAAPGQSIYTTWSPSAPYATVIYGTSYNIMGMKYAQETGTSFAAPHVAGAAAFLWTLDPGLSYRQVKRALIGGVQYNPSVAGKVSTYGDLNLFKSAVFVTTNQIP